MTVVAPDAHDFAPDASQLTPDAGLSHQITFLLPRHLVPPALCTSNALLSHPPPPVGSSSCHAICTSGMLTFAHLHIGLVNFYTFAHQGSQRLNFYTSGFSTFTHLHIRLVNFYTFAHRACQLLHICTSGLSTFKHWHIRLVNF